MNSKTSGLMSMLRLDLIGLRPMATSMAILMGIAVVMGVGFDQPAIGAPMIGVGFAILPMNAFTADQMYKMNALYGSLPMRRRDVVNARYLLIWIMLSVAVVLLYAMIAVSGAGSEPGMWLMPIWMGIALSLLPSVQIPVGIKFGPQTGTWAVMIPFVVIMAGAFVISQVDGVVARLGQVLAWVNAHPAQVTATGALVAVVVMAASWVASQRIYAAQDH